jgi:predicted 2-oxoglutarate/Fe(II)-dependent dioxygenase YbiX/peroxiredoxin
MPRYAQLSPGDPAPWFHARSTANPRFAFDSTAGRYLVLLFHGSAADPHGAAALAAVRARPDLFDDDHASCFAVSADPADEAEGRLTDRYPGFRVFWDADGQVGRLYGALPDEVEPGAAGVQMRRMWVVLDPTLRVRAVVPFAGDRSDLAAAIGLVAALPPPGRFAGFELQAPVLVLPDVFEPAFCARLVELYAAHGGEESGVMRDVDGKTVGVMDARHKRRKDHMIEDRETIGEVQARFMRRVVPEIRKVHQFHVTRMERYLVACYAAEDGGHFAPHRDNTTQGTAHRRFAVSVNLNDDFDGGEVRFPEYGQRGFKAPTGGAVVFSCSLLHTVGRVTRGRRYAFLPFLYDEAAAKLREANIAKVSEELAGYRA